MEGFEVKDLTASVTVNLANKITSGGHSDVYRGSLALAGDGDTTVVAVKLPRYAPTHVSPKTITAVKNEIDLWSKLEHPNILPLLGIYRRSKADVLPGAVSPWCDDGTLIEYLRSARNGTTKRKKAPMKDGSFALLCLEVDMLSQATKGLEYLHAQNIIHGDLKGVNILVQNGIARLSDFGYSVVVVERLGSTSSHLGTSRWFAPEFLESGARRTREADIWALGCVILEVRTLEVPYHDRTDQAVHTALYDGDLPYTYPGNMNGNLWRSAARCWSRRPSDRPTSQVISAYLQHIADTLRYLSRIPVYSSGLSLSEFTTALLSEIARRFEEEDAGLYRGPSGVRDAIAALQHLGEPCSSAAVRSCARRIAARDPALADQLMTTLTSPELRSPLVLRGDASGPFAWAKAVAFLPDSRRLVSSSWDETLCIWDINTGETVIDPLEGHTREVSCVAVHGSRIASCSYDGTFRVWDGDNGAVVLGPITAHDCKALNCIAFSRDGTYIATAGEDNSAAIWDTNTGVQLCEMVGHTDPVMCVAFTEDGTRLVSGSKDNTVYIWDVASGECIGDPLTGHTDFVIAVCCSRDNRRIFSSSTDCTIRIWNAETRAAIVEPLRMDDKVVCIALSPDGTRLVSGSSSGKIALWNAETGTAIPTQFRDHGDTVWGVAFSPDGRKIASVSDDGSIGLWDAADDWKRYDIDDEDADLEID